MSGVRHPVLASYVRRLTSDIWRLSSDFRSSTSEQNLLFSICRMPHPAFSIRSPIPTSDIRHPISDL